MVVKTADQFNTKYKDYLDGRHYGCAITNEKAIAYLDSKFQEFIKVPGFKFQQIKSKFHYYCFYCDELSDDAVVEVEQELKRIIDEDNQNSKTNI